MKLAVTSPVTYHGWLAHSIPNYCFNIKAFA